MQRKGPISSWMMNLQYVEILPSKNLGVCENESGNNLAPCHFDRFGEIFPSEIPRYTCRVGTFLENNRHISSA